MRPSRLSLPALALLGLMLAGLGGAGGYYMYTVYDYVEHDNEFCLSCHLMVDPYERFARSAHQDLGCKDCHRPSLIERSRMGLTQFIENPSELSTHAEVPNQLCASCHVDGDPERWSVVAATAGHRAHLESSDPALAGLQCVECHSSSLHEFAATDRTCAQSGCHEDTGIRLGGMSDLTIHCAACHGFGVTVESAGVDEALAALAPGSDTCMSCHAMQALASMPENDPHEGSCASCHNPHVQETPAEAAASCTDSGCHTDPASLSPFHRGIDESVAASCLTCHGAHDFAVDGTNCLACHQEIFDAPAAGGGGGAGGAGGAGVAGAAGAVGATEARGAAGAVSSPYIHAVTTRFAATPSAAVAGDRLQERPLFSHLEHRAQECSDCHATEPEHGALTVTTVADCRSCHHTAPVADDCAACHQPAGAEEEPLEVRRTLQLMVGVRPDRPFPFGHEAHASLTCESCHSQDPGRSAASVDCASCHEPHHQATAECASCHLPAAPGAHRVETAHVGCGGSGCHQDLPFERVERTRSVCLVCHQEQVDHRPGESCAECHAMTGPGFGAGP